MLPWVRSSLPSQYERPQSAQFFAGLPVTKHCVPGGSSGCSRGMHSDLAPMASAVALRFRTCSSISTSSALATEQQNN